MPACEYWLGGGYPPRLLLRLVADTVADDIAEPRDAAIGDVVVGGGARLAAADDAGVVKHTQVLGDVGLAGAEGIDDFADVHLALLQEDAEDGETRGIAKHAEAFGDVFEEMSGNGLGHVGHCMTVE